MLIIRRISSINTTSGTRIEPRCTVNKTLKNVDDSLTKINEWENVLHLVGHCHVQLALFGGSKVSPARPSDRSSINP